MPDPVSLIVASVGVVTGLSGIALAWWRTSGERGDRKLDRFWDSYERLLKLARAEGNDDQLAETTREYRAQLKAWQAQQRLEAIAPRQISAQGVHTNLTDDEIDRLKRLLEASAELSPALIAPDEYFFRGNANYEAGRYEEAVAAYDQALQLDPHDLLSLSSRGAALRRLGRYQEALAAYARVFKLYPEFDGSIKRDIAVEVLYDRARIFSQMNQTDEAVENLSRSIEFRSEYRDLARTESDFDNIRDDPRFRELVGEDELPEEPTTSP